MATNIGLPGIWAQVFWALIVAAAVAAAAAAGAKGKSFYREALEPPESLIKQREKQKAVEQRWELMGPKEQKSQRGRAKWFPDMKKIPIPKKADSRKPPPPEKFRCFLVDICWTSWT